MKTSHHNIKKYNNKQVTINKIKELYTGLKAFFLGTNLENSGYTEKNEKQLSKQISTPITVGLLAIMFTICIFIVWAGVAPLDNAATAEGYIKLNNNKKIVQHYEGGIVENILVKDGNTVKQGETLVTLNKSKVNTELLKTLWEINYGSLVEQRIEQLLNLIKKIRDHQNINLYNANLLIDSKKLIDLHKLNQIELNKLFITQKELFDTFRKSISSKIAVHISQLAQIESEIEAYKHKINSYYKLHKISKQEIQRRKKLYENRLETIDNIAREEKEFLNIELSILEIKTKLRSFNSKKLEITSIFANFLDQENIKLSDEYKRNKRELLHYKSSYIQVKDLYQRSTIKAPCSGIINDMQVHTVGGIIPHNFKIMEIIPQNDALVIEAFIKANDIDNIQPNTKVKIQLSAFKTRTTPRILGKVLSVSADRFNKEGYNNIVPVGYYKVKIDIPNEEIQKINSEIKLVPGMPVVVFIVKGTRTFAQYLYSPIKDSFHRAFKET